MRARQVTAAAGGGATAWWCWAAVVLGHFLGCARAGLLESNPGLAYNFYGRSCPSVDSVVRGITWQQVAGNPALAGKLLRLHFHDCFVNGCDASILLDNPQSEKTAAPNLSLGGFEVINAIKARLEQVCPGVVSCADILLDNPQSEKTAAPNLSLGGFEVINAIKARLEQVCPGVVSCADIVALAAREAVSYQFRASLWQVETGRRDGTVSLASNTGALPSPFAWFGALLQTFANRGLNLTDLVALSGAHTIGVASCSSVTPRLYRGNAVSVDPLLDAAYSRRLMSTCPIPSSPGSTVGLDAGTPLRFDSSFYVNLQRRRGTLFSDSALMQNAAAARMVADLTDPIKFYAAFSMSMKKMGRVDVLTRTRGQIRKQCRQVNSS